MQFDTPRRTPNRDLPGPRAPGILQVGRLALEVHAWIDSGKQTSPSYDMATCVFVFVPEVVGC